MDHVKGKYIFYILYQSNTYTRKNTIRNPEAIVVDDCCLKEEKKSGDILWI